MIILKMDYVEGSAFDQHIIDGKHILEPALKRMGFHNLNQHTIAKDLGLKNLEDLHAALGSGGIRIAQVIGQAQNQLKPE